MIVNNRVANVHHEGVEDSRMLQRKVLEELALARTGKALYDGIFDFYFLVRVDVSKCILFGIIVRGEMVAVECRV